MTIDYATTHLEKNKNSIYSLLHQSTEAEYQWKQSQDKWNLLEIICHLYDEECEDFKTRFKNVIETPHKRPPAIDPVAWVKDRKYTEQNFEEKLSSFIQERDESIKYLKRLLNPDLTQGYDYGKFGHVDGIFFLTNWLAHDYLHIKQIVRLKYDYTSQLSDKQIDYAGTWT